MYLNSRVGIKTAHYNGERVRSSIAEGPESWCEPDAGKSWVTVSGRPGHVVRTQTPAVDAAVRGRNARKRGRADRHILGAIPAVVGDFERDCCLRTVDQVTQVLNDKAGALLHAANRRW